jgi:hypothetical protein
MGGVSWNCELNAGKADAETFYSLREVLASEDFEFGKLSGSGPV